MPWTGYSSNVSKVSRLVLLSQPNPNLPPFRGRRESANFIVIPVFGIGFSMVALTAHFYCTLHNIIAHLLFIIVID